MKTLLASLIGAAMLLAAPCFAAEDDTPPSVAPPPQSSAQNAPRAPSKLEARFTTQWSGGSSTAQVPAEAAPRVPPRPPKAASD